MENQSLNFNRYGEASYTVNEDDIIIYQSRYVHPSLSDKVLHQIYSVFIFKENKIRWLGMVAHACNPSTLRGRGGRTTLGVAIVQMPDNNEHDRRNLCPLGA